MITGPTPTVQLTLSNALLYTSAVSFNPNYGGYAVSADLNITQTPDFLSYIGIVGGSAPINGSLSLNGTYTFTTGEPIYIQEDATVAHSYNGSTGDVWSASVDPVI